MESYARELSIRYANASDNDTVSRLKDTCNGLLEEKKFLNGKLEKMEREMKALKKMKSTGNKGKEVEELKSKWEILTDFFVRVYQESSRGERQSSG